MTKQEANRVARAIEEDPDCLVRGYVHHGEGSWTVDAVDLRTGSTFRIVSMEDWRDRVREAELYT